MPKLLSGQVLRTGGSGQFIALPGAQPALGPSPSTATGFTLITDSVGITKYSNVLGKLAFADGVITADVLDQNITVGQNGTGTFVINTPALFNNTVVFANTFSFVDVVATGHIQFTGGYNSTATTNGTLVVTGGVGITQDTYIGGTLVTEGLLDAQGQVNLSPQAADVTIQPSAGGTVIIRPNVAGDIDNVDIGSLAARSGRFTTLEAIDTLLVSSTASSTSTTSGALQVAGGVGVAKSLYADKLFDNNLRVITQVNVGPGLSGGGNGPLIALTNTGVLSLTAGTGTFVNTTTGAVVLWTYGNTLQAVTEQGNTTTVPVYFNSTTNATSLTTASVVVSAGVAVGQDLRVGGTIYGNLTANTVTALTAIFSSTQITNINASTSSLVNNALYVAGGAGVQSNLTVGGDTFVYGNLTVLGSYTTVISSVADVGRKVVALSTSAGPAILSIDSGITVGPISAPFVKFMFDGISSWRSTGNVIPTTNGAYSLGNNSFQWNTVYSQYEKISGATPSTSPITGALTVTGGVGIGGNIYTSGQLRVLDATASTSTLTGAVVISGGVGIGGSTNVGGQLRVYATTSATNTYSGALIVNGGAGFAGDIYARNFFDATGNQFVTTSTINQYGVTNLSAGTDTAVSTSTGIVKVWSTATLQSITLRGGSTDQALSLTNTTDATSTTTGALTVSGGVAIRKNLYVGGNAVIYGSVTFTGTATNVLTTNTVFTDNLIELHKPTGNQWTTNDGKDIGIKIHYYDDADKFGFFGRANDTGYLEWYSTGTESGATFSGSYGTFKTGVVRLVGNSPATNTYSGALIVQGGAGIGGNLYAYNIYSNGSQVLTAASIASYGVSVIQAGTDTAISTSTGDVTVWNVSTLDSVAHRGNATTSSIYIDNTLTVSGNVLFESSLTVTQSVTADSLVLFNTIHAGNAYLAAIEGTDLTLSGNILTTSPSAYPVKIDSDVDSTSSYYVRNINSGTNAYSSYYAENDIGDTIELGISSSGRQIHGYTTGSAFIHVSSSTDSFNIGNRSIINLYTQGLFDADVPTLSLSTSGVVTLVSNLVITDNNYDPAPQSTLLLTSSARVGYSSITLANTSLDGQSFTLDVGGSYRSAQDGAAIDEGNFTLRDNVANEYRLIVKKTTGNILIGTEIDDDFNKLQLVGSFTATDNVYANTGTFVNLNVLQTSTFYTDLVVYNTLNVRSTATFQAGLVSETTSTFNKTVIIGSSSIETAVTIINTTDPTSIDSFDATLYRSARVMVQITDGDTYHLVEIVLLHDNSGQVHKSEYGIISTGNPLGEFTADMTNGQVVLYFTAYFDTAKTVNVVRTTISV